MVLFINMRIFKWYKKLTRRRFVCASGIYFFSHTEKITDKATSLTDDGFKEDGDSLQLQYLLVNIHSTRARICWYLFE